VDSEYDDIMDAPLIPQPDWFTEEQLDAIEMELIKTAGAGAEPVDLAKKRDQEKQMLTSFQKDPGTHTFMPLLNSMRPYMMWAARGNMARSPIPQAAHEALARQSFYDAIRTYDPKKGGSFRTHMVNTVKEKGKRLNLKYQNIGYIPETRATKYQSFQNTVHLLREELGREPSDIEIADESGISVREIERLRKEISTDLIGREQFASKGMAFAQSDRAMQAARDIYYTLEPKHQVVLEHIVGLNGKPSLVKPSGKSDISGIAKATGLKISDVRSARKTIKRKLMDYRSFMGKSDLDSPVFDESED
jgi:hypothetical protein